MFQKNAPKSNEVVEAESASKSERPETKSKNEKSSKALGGTNLILSDVEITGTVKFKNDVVIDGRIEGEIFSDGSVTIGPKATVNAEIRSKCVVVQGCVNGDIYASDRLELMENAEVPGDIKAAVLSMQAGAVLVGTSAVGAVPSKDNSSSGSDAASSERSKSRGERELARA